MSSEEDDDLEEEELLQKALQEQAHRDLQYKRPPNYPPPIISPAAAGPPLRPSGAPPMRQPPSAPPSRPPPKPNNIEDDEESEVELLSLSSEDEDAPQSRRTSAPAAADAKRGSRTADEESDLEWDEEDDEADCWKRVDEAELVRRVREMRESRSAPTSSQARLRKTATYSRKATMAPEALPRGDDFIDPLGLGVIDIKNMTLVTDNMSSSQASAVMSERGTSKRGLLQGSASRKDDGVTSPPQTPASRDHVSREKILYHSESFDPKFFLSRIHQNTSAADLEAGEQALKMDLQSRKQQLKQLVKENFDCFVSCKNTIDDIHSKLQQIETDPEGAGTIQLSSAIHNVDKVANRAFEPLFERQVQAERIRSVQGMLQRFRTLFNLPSTIRTNINKGDYDLAVREYKKAKSIVLPTHVGILKRVLEEVEKVIQEFKEKLYKSMEDPQLELSQLESTIRLLTDLEPDSDPVWYYLNIQNRRIRGLLEGCSLEHEARMDALHGRVREKVESDARWKQLQRESNKASDVDYSLLLGEQDGEAGERRINESTGDESDALLGRLIRRLTAVVVQHVPNFWRLALAIFHGKFAKLSQGGSVNGALELTKKNKPIASEQHLHEEKAADLKCTNHSLDEVVAMVIEIISLYESKVLNAFLVLADSQVVRPYMREAVADVSKSCFALESKDYAPPSAVQALFVLRTELTRVFILRLCSVMRSTTAEIVSEENWIPVSTMERGSSPFAISALPLRFHNMLISSMDQMKEMIERLKQDASTVHDMSVQVRQMQDSVRSTFFECFLSFKECLDKYASELSQKNQLPESEAVDNGQHPADRGHFVGLQVGAKIANPHQKLLMVLSNIGYCKSSLLPDLSQKYKYIWIQAGKGKTLEEDGSTMADEVIEAFSASEENILGQYTYAKATLIGTAAAAYLLEDGVQWGAAPPVKGIRDAAVELLHPLIAVHAEVYAGAKPFLEKAISILVEGLMDALLNVFNENKSKALRVLDLQGYCQISLEMEYLETALQTYLSAAAREALKALRELLKDKVLETQSEVEKLGHRRSTRGSEDGLQLEERMQNPPMSSEEVAAFERQVCSDFLPTELRRTRLNTICFIETHLQSEASDGGRRWPSATSASLAGPVVHARTTYTLGSTISKHRRRPSGSSLSDSDSGKPFPGLPPLSPFHQSSYASSDVGSETGSSDMRLRNSLNSERFMKLQPETKRTSRRTTLGALEDDLR